MTDKKTTGKQKVSGLNPTELAANLEQAFMAGLGALSDPQKIGSSSFESLVQRGEKFRKKATDRTEELLQDVQEALRDMTEDAQTKAEGLLEQVRDSSRLEQLNTAFDTRVAGAMKRIGVASKKDVEALDRKLNKLMKDVAARKAPAKSKASTKRKTKKTAAKRTTKKKASTRKVAKKATRKRAASKSKVARK